MPWYPISNIKAGVSNALNHISGVWPPCCGDVARCMRPRTIPLAMMTMGLLIFYGYGALLCGPFGPLGAPLKQTVVSLDVDECKNNPCQNDGICTNTDGDFTCQCTEQWTGKTCDKGELRLCIKQIISFNELRDVHPSGKKLCLYFVLEQFFLPSTSLPRWPYLRCPCCRESHPRTEELGNKNISNTIMIMIMIIHLYSTFSICICSNCAVHKL